jgi:hypothetical protein
LTVQPTDEFYVGYAERAPAGTARLVRRVVVAAAAATLLAAAVSAWVQERLPTGVFEFGTYRSFEGVLYETPVPLLRITGPLPGPPASAILLAGPGKRGLPAFARGHHGRKVRFRGTLVYRENATLIEMNDPESFEDLGGPLELERRTRAEVVGQVILAGELVDPKCFLGVMRPATGKVHRACAVRCLDGGIPPGLLVGGTVLILVGSEDRPLEFDPQWAGRRVEVQGKLELHDELPVVRTSRLRLLAD